MRKQEKENTLNGATSCLNASCTNMVEVKGERTFFSRQSAIFDTEKRMIKSMISVKMPSRKKRLGKRKFQY